ncbi:MAG: hypothetical protein V7K99_27170 [Nostoc sp.]
MSLYCHLLSCLDPHKRINWIHLKRSLFNYALTKTLIQRSLML